MDHCTDYILGVTAKMPATTNSEDTNTDFDQFTSSWRIGATIGGTFLVSGLKEGAPIAALRLTIGPELGIQEFSYFPQAGNAQATDWHVSEDLTADALYFNLTSLWAFEATYRMAADWSASPATGIVSQGTPSTVTNKVISDGVVQPNMMGRAFMYFAFSNGAPFAVGPAASVSFAGPQGRAVTFNQTTAFREELWLYYLPPDAKPANLRIGLAPYLTEYSRGTDPQGRQVLPGVLLQVRYGAAASPVYAY